MDQNQDVLNISKYKKTHKIAEATSKNSCRNFHIITEVSRETKSTPQQDSRNSRGDESETLPPPVEHPILNKTNKQRRRPKQTAATKTTT